MIEDLIATICKVDVDAEWDNRDPGWAVWHSCFNTIHRQNKNNYK